MGAVFFRLGDDDGFWGYNENKNFVLSMNHINLEEPNPTLADLIDRVNQGQEATLITIDE